jgi:hypothetical protein
VDLWGARVFSGKPQVLSIQDHRRHQERIYNSKRLSDTQQRFGRRRGVRTAVVALSGKKAKTNTKQKL